MTIDRTKLWQDIRNTSTAAFEFLLSQNMFIVSNVLLGMAIAQLNNISNDELDNFKRVCVLNLHKLWQKYKSATSRLRAKKGPAPPPLGNFADISYLKENFKPHLLRDFCTLCSGVLVSDSLLHMLL